MGRGTVEEVVELSMEMTCWQVEDISEDKARETKEDVEKLKLEKMTGVEPEPKLQSPDSTSLIPAGGHRTYFVVITALFLILQAYFRSCLFPVPGSLSRRI